MTLDRFTLFGLDSRSGHWIVKSYRFPPAHVTRTTTVYRHHVLIIDDVSKLRIHEPIEIERTLAD